MKALVASVLLLGGCAVTPPTRVQPLAPEFDAAIEWAVATLPAVPGLAVAVYSRDGVYTRAFGVTDVNTRERATPDTAFYIASSTKPLTALALALLDERGALDLDATLSAVAPDARFPAEVRPDEVTLRNLLTHTSGIENNPIGLRFAFSGEHTPDKLWSLLASSKPNTRAPLGTFAYTNVGYNIATILTDRQHGVVWQTPLDREIFAPAGMTRTSTRISTAMARRWSLARPHAWSAATGHCERIDLEKTDATMHSAGGVVMSARDAARWLELMAEDGRLGGKQVLPATVVRSTRVPGADLDESEDGFTRKHYGLGWYVGTYRDDAMLQQYGGFPGARAHVSYLPDRHVGVAVFINDSSVSGPVVDLVAKFVYDRLAGRSEARADFDLAVAKLATDGPARFSAALADRAGRPWKLSRPLADYAGRYESAELGTIELAVAGEGISGRIGAVRVTGVPSRDADAIRLEFAPLQGETARFVFEGGERPAAVMFGGLRLARR